MGTRNPEVDAWFDRYENPMKVVALRTRELMLDADERIGETIKWSTPTFTYRGNLASFQPRAKQFVSLLFHTGASIPGEHPLLEGGGDVARYVRLADLEAVERERPALEAVVRAVVRRARRSGRLNGVAGDLGLEFARRAPKVLLHDHLDGGCARKR